jgi:hypothetical protein
VIISKTSIAAEKIGLDKQKHLLLFMETRFGKGHKWLVWKVNFKSLLCKIIRIGFVNAYFSPCYKSTIFRSEIGE